MRAVTRYHRRWPHEENGDDELTDSMAITPPGSWPVCEELDQEEQECSSAAMSKRMVTFAQEFGNPHHRSMGDESGEEQRKRLSAIKYTLVLDPVLHTVTLRPREEQEQDQDQDQEEFDDVDLAEHGAYVEQPAPVLRPRRQRHRIIREVEDDEAEEERANADTEDELDQDDIDEEEDTGELVDDYEDEAERASEVAEELAPYDVAVEHLLNLLDDLRDDTDGEQERNRKIGFRYSRARVVAVAGGVRTLKQRVEALVDPLTAYCPGHAADLRRALRSLSNSVVHLLNGVQARVDTYAEQKMEEVRNLVAAIRPLLVDLLLEACSIAETNHDLIRQAALLKEAIGLGTSTVRTLKRAWDEMLDISQLSNNIKHMVKLCLLASDEANGMNHTTAKRIKRRSVRLGKATDILVKGVRQGLEVDEQFDRLVRALANWLDAVNQAHQELRRLR